MDWQGESSRGEAARLQMMLQERSAEAAAAADAAAERQKASHRDQMNLVAQVSISVFIKFQEQQCGCSYLQRLNAQSDLRSRSTMQTAIESNRVSSQRSLLQHAVLSLRESSRVLFAKHFFCRGWLLKQSNMGVCVVDFEPC